MDDANSSDEIFTDVELRSTGPHENQSFESHDDDQNEVLDDQQSSGGSNTIVPEVLEDENDDVIVQNESPRRGKYNLRPNPTPNFTDEYRY